MFVAGLPARLQNREDPHGNVCGKKDGHKNRTRLTGCLFFTSQTPAIHAGVFLFLSLSITLMILYCRNVIRAAK